MPPASNISLGGQGSGFGSFGTVNTSNVTENQQQQVTGGSAQATTGASAISLSTGSDANITLTQESPQAIAALLSTSNNALASMNSLALGSLAEADLITTRSLEIAKQTTKSGTQQTGDIVIWLVAIGAVGFVVYAYMRK